MTDGKNETFLSCLTGVFGFYYFPAVFFPLQSGIDVFFPFVEEDFLPFFSLDRGFLHVNNPLKTN